MKQLIEFIPLILFFVFYKFYGVQAAAITLLVATVVQLIALKLIYKEVQKMQLFIAITVLVFAGLTAYFNDDAFLKFKVTLVNALFAIVLLVSQFVFKSPLIKYVLGKEMTLKDRTWNVLNTGWAIFFIICMLANIYISTYLSQDAWYIFKAFGLFGMTIVATIITIAYIYPELKEKNL